MAGSCVPPGRRHHHPRRPRPDRATRPGWYRIVSDDRRAALSRRPAIPRPAGVVAQDPIAALWGAPVTEHGGYWVEDGPGVGHRHRRPPSRRAPPALRGRHRPDRRRFQSEFAGACPGPGPGHGVHSSLPRPPSTCTPAPPWCATPHPAQPGAPACGPTPTCCAGWWDQPALPAPGSLPLEGGRFRRRPVGRRRGASWHAHGAAGPAGRLCRSPSTPPSTCAASSPRRRARTPSSGASSPAPSRPGRCWRRPGCSRRSSTGRRRRPAGPAPLRRRTGVGRRRPSCFDELGLPLDGRWLARQGHRGRWVSVVPPRGPFLRGLVRRTAASVQRRVAAVVGDAGLARRRRPRPSPGPTSAGAGCSTSARPAPGSSPSRSTSAGGRGGARPWRRRWAVGLGRPGPRPVVAGAGGAAADDVPSGRGRRAAPRMRHAVTLRYWDDLPEHEVAARMNIAPGTASALP